MPNILFFDGACGMCTRSVELLDRLDHTGKLQTEPLQSPGTSQRLGISPSELLESVRWLDSSGAVYFRRRGRQRRRVGGDRYPNPVNHLPDSWCRFYRGSHLPMGGREPVSLSRDYSVLPVTPERLLS